MCGLGGLCADSFLLLFTILLTCHIAPSQLEWLVAPFSSMEHYELVDFSFKDGPWTHTEPQQPRRASRSPQESLRLVHESCPEPEGISRPIQTVA